MKLNMISKLNHQAHHSIYLDINVIVSSNLKVKILIQQYQSSMKFSSDKNYIFESASEQLVFYIHMMNAALFFVHMINHTDQSVTML